MSPCCFRRLSAPALLALILGAAAPAAAADTPADTLSVSQAPASPGPIYVDPSDLGLGTSVVYTRVPNSSDVAALGYVEYVRHVVVWLPAWPEDFAAIEPLAKVLLPEGADLVVFLQGYPPTRSQAAVWNLLHQPLRIIMLVDGPPSDRGMILEMNSLRGLERVVATMDRPSRLGFERLQRPLSFRVLVR